MLSLQGFLIFSAIFATALGQSTEKPAPIPTATAKAADPQPRDFKSPAAVQEFKNKILQIHNDLRKTHQAPPMEFNPNQTINDMTQAEAERKLNSYVKLGEFTPNPDDVDDRSYNDNTWAYTSFAKRNWNATMVTREWVNQGKLHNWTTNYFDTATGHFTQMIWLSTEFISVGAAAGRTDKGRQYVKVVVVRYAPPGNILDKDTFAENVLPCPSTTPAP